MGGSSSHKCGRGGIFFDPGGYELKDNSLKTYNKDKKTMTKAKERCFTLKEQKAITLKETEQA
jgi:hypothetical protein